jgi:hypothetical protein
VAVPLLDTLLVVSLVVVVLVRLAWVLGYFGTFVRRRGHEGRLAVVRRASSSLTIDVYPVPATPEEEAARHTRFFQGAAGQVDTLLLIGSVALAAWTQLFSAAGHEPGNPLAPITRHLLLVSAAVLIAGPVLFRSPGTHVTFLGRESMMAVGFSALVLSLASAVADVFGVVGAIVAVVAALLLVGRDVAEALLLLPSLAYMTTTPRAAGDPMRAAQPEAGQA